MKCPLLLIGWNAARGGERVYKPDCLKEGCAWYDKEFQICAVGTLTQAMYSLKLIASDIKEKLPQARQTY